MSIRDEDILREMGSERPYGTPTYIIRNRLVLNGYPTLLTTANVRAAIKRLEGRGLVERAQRSSVNSISWVRAD